LTTQVETLEKSTAPKISAMIHLFHSLRIALSTIPTFKPTAYAAKVKINPEPYTAVRLSKVTELKSCIAASIFDHP
ncbi:hypothetical protein QMO42_29950, partial [Pseudomonas aeruginosa]